MTKTSPVELPSAYPTHPHASEEARAVAAEGLILLSEVGSGVHGTALPGTDDTDWMGVCLESPQYVTGLETFEQFERHTAWDREDGVRERSGAGDLDVTIYGARKFCRLALAGNPSILTLLFVPDDALVFQNWQGLGLREMAPAFVSLRAAGRYLGYLRAQRDGMTGQGRVNRPQLVDVYGYDVKFAAHAIRLGAQGVELMSTGRIQLPMRRAWRERLLEVRRGEVPLAEVQAQVDVLEQELAWMRRDNPGGLRLQPDRAAVNDWLHEAYRYAWDHR